MLNNLKINDINFIYFNKIDEIYISFENSLDNFKEIICLIYKIYYQNDQFEIINNTTNIDNAGIKILNITLIVSL